MNKEKLLRMVRPRAKVLFYCKGFVCGIGWFQPALLRLEILDNSSEVDIFTLFCLVICGIGFFLSWEITKEGV